VTISKTNSQTTPLNEAGRQGGGQPGGWGNSRKGGESGVDGVTGTREKKICGEEKKR